MSRGDTLDFQIFGCVTGKFEDFSSEVFKDGSDVDSSCARDFRISMSNVRVASRSHTFGAHSHLVLGVILEKTLDTAAGELIVNLSAFTPLEIEQQLTLIFHGS